MHQTQLGSMYHARAAAESEQWKKRMQIAHSNQRALQLTFARKLVTLLSLLIEVWPTTTQRTKRKNLRAELKKLLVSLQTQMTYSKSEKKKKVFCKNESTKNIAAAAARVFFSLSFSFNIQRLLNSTHQVSLSCSKVCKLVSFLCVWSTECED